MLKLNIVRDGLMGVESIFVTKLKQLLSGGIMASSAISGLSSSLYPKIFDSCDCKYAKCCTCFYFCSHHLNHWWYLWRHKASEKLLLQTVQYKFALTSDFLSVSASLHLFALFIDISCIFIVTSKMKLYLLPLLGGRIVYQKISVHVSV